MTRSALPLGAPDTEPGGKAAARRSPQPTSSSSSARTLDTRWTSPGCSSTCSRDGTATEPVRATIDRSLRTRSTIITFSASSFGLQVGRDPPGPLDGAGQDASTPPCGGTARATRGERDTVRGEVDVPAERRRVALGEQGRQPAHLAGVRIGQPRGQDPADVHLVDVAGRDARPDLGDRGQERGPIQGRRPGFHRGSAPPAPRRGRRPVVGETGAHHVALERRHDRPPARAVERGRVPGDVDQAGRQPASQVGRRRGVAPSARSRAPAGGPHPPTVARA